MTDATPEAKPPIDPWLLEILVCPVSRAPLRYDAAREALVCDVSRLAYPIRDGVPTLLPEEATSLDEPSSSQAEAGESAS